MASTYFEYYGGGRVIVRQDHDATFLGFVLRGELEVTTARLDPVFGNVVTEVTGQLGPGAVFGEVSLLHNVPRTNTVTSVSQYTCCQYSSYKSNSRHWNFYWICEI